MREEWTKKKLQYLNDLDVKYQFSGFYSQIISIIRDNFIKWTYILSIHEVERFLWTMWIFSFWFVVCFLFKKINISSKNNQFFIGLQFVQLILQKKRDVDE